MTVQAPVTFNADTGLQKIMAFPTCFNTYKGQNLTCPFYPAVSFCTDRGLSCRYPLDMTVQWLFQWQALPTLQSP